MCLEGYSKLVGGRKGERWWRIWSVVTDMGLDDSAHVVCRVEEEGGRRGASVLHYTVVHVCMVCVTKYAFLSL